MVIIIALAVLVFIFFFLRKHTGPAHLAMIAGLSVFELFGLGLVQWLHGLDFLRAAPESLLKNSVYLALIVAFPIILYLRSGRGGFGGIFRFIEALIFAAVMVSLISEPLAYFFPFDSLATQISNFIQTIKGPIVAVGVIAAYVDLLFASPMRRRRR